MEKHTIESPSYKHQQHCNPIRQTQCLQNTAWTREHTPVLSPALHMCLPDRAKRPTHGVMMTPSGHMANGMPRAAGRSMKQQDTFSHVSVAMPDVMYHIFCSLQTLGGQKALLHLEISSHIHSYFKNTPCRTGEMTLQKTQTHFPTPTW